MRGSNKVFKCYVTDNQTKNMGGGDRLVGPWLLYRTPSWYPLLILRHLKFRCVDHIRSTYFFMVSDQKLLLNISIKQNNSILLLYKGFTWCVITLKPLLLFRMLKGVNIFIMCRQAKGFHYFSKSRVVWPLTLDLVTSVGYLKGYNCSSVPSFMSV